LGFFFPSVNFKKEEDAIDIMKTLITTENMHHNIIILEKMWVHNAQIIVSTCMYTHKMLPADLPRLSWDLKMAFIGRGTMSLTLMLLSLCRWVFFLLLEATQKTQRVFFTQLEENSFYCTIG
jgi:hypothetical protein